MLPPIEPHPVTLEGRHVRLEPLSLAHHDRLCAVGLDGELWRWAQTSLATPTDMRAYIETALTERRLDETVAVKPSTGGEYFHTFREMFRHAIDHSSYHRGQLVTLLRQVGATPPGTGLIAFYREHRGRAT